MQRLSSELYIGQSHQTFQHRFLFLRAVCQRATRRDIGFYRLIQFGYKMYFIVNFEEIYIISMSFLIKFILYGIYYGNVN